MYELIILGGGPAGMTAAVYAARKRINTMLLSKDVGDQVLIDKIIPAPNISLFLEYEVLEIRGVDRVETLTIRHLKTRETDELAVGDIFIEIGLILNSDLARDVVDRNRAGEIKVNCGNETNVAGIFAAGDVTSVPEKQIVIAAGEGAKASLAAHRYLQRI